MLAELLMAKYGWELWSSPIPPDDEVRRRGEWKPWDVFRDGFLVGVWTGPDRDLLCVKECATNEEAELWLAPSGPTILLATLRSVAKLVWTEHGASVYARLRWPLHRSSPKS